MKRVIPILRAVHTDIWIGFIIFLAASAGCLIYMKAFGIVTGQQDNVSYMLRPAVYMAKGYGFADAEPLPEDIRAFLAHETPTFDGEIAPSPSIGPTRAMAHMDRYYLIYSVGVIWRIFGVSWAAVRVLSSLSFGVSVAVVFGIFRLGMGRTTSLIGTALSMISPVVLMQVTSIRDFTKAPFILGTILVCGYILAHAMPRRRYFCMALLAGLLVGAGIGFRTDSIVCFPISLFFVAVVARGAPHLSVKTRLMGTALLLAGLIPPAWPTMTMTAETGGNNSFYLTQGFSAPCLHDSDMIRASYSPLYTHADYIVHAYIYQFAHTHLEYYKRAHRGLRMLSSLSDFADSQVIPATPAALGASQRLITHQERLDIWTPPAEKAARRYVFELLTTFPADVLTRWYSTALRIIRHLHPVCFFADRSNVLIDAIWRFEAPVSQHLYHWGLFYALAAMAIISAKSIRLALGTLCIFIYFCGYPSLEFQWRHAFHLGFAAYWFPSFVLDRVIVGANPLRIRAVITSFRLPSLRALVRPVLRTAGFAVCAAALLCVPLYAARFFQSRTVARVFEQYQQADLEPLPHAEMTDTDGHTLFFPMRLPSFEGIPPVELWNALALTGLPVKRVPDVLVEYIVAEVTATTHNASMDIRYEDVAAFFNMKEYFILRDEPRPCTFRIFFPVFRFTDNFVPPYGSPTSTFKGVAFDEGVEFKQFYRVRNKDDFALLMDMWLPSDPALLRNGQRVRLLTM